MGNGLLAQWRGRIVGRGAVAAALLAVPIAVAGVIGFNGGLGGVAGGFFAALGGPEPEAAGAAAPGGGLDGALATLVGPPGGPGDDSPTREPEDRNPEGSGPTDDGPGPGPGVNPNVQLPNVPDVTVPVDNPQGSVDSLVDDVNRTVDGLVGNR